MPLILNIKEFLKLLNEGKEVIDTLFGKKDTLQKDEIIPNIASQNPEIIFNRLILHGIIHEKNEKINLDDRIVTLLEDYLEIGEINTETISGDIKNLNYNIAYYRNDNQIKYLKDIRKTLRKINNTITRQIILLDNQIDRTYKNEQNYINKLSKLENYRNERDNILTLIEETEQILNTEKVFFSNVRDEEIQLYQHELKKNLFENKDFLIAIQSQIIDYINRIKINPEIAEKIHKYKELKDNAELRYKTNITKIITKNTNLLFGQQENFKWHVPLDFLSNTDKGRKILNSVRQKINSKEVTEEKPVKQIKANLKKEKQVAARLDIDKFFERFFETDLDLFSFVMTNNYPENVPNELDDKLSYFVEMTLDYSDKIQFAKRLNYFEYTDEKGIKYKLGYAEIYAKK